MRKSTAAFWLLIIMVAITAGVSIVALLSNKPDETGIYNQFIDIMKYAIALVGGGFVGVQIGEGKSNEN